MAKVTGGVVGFWSDDHKCVEAARKVREAGFKKFDAITPFPVHGMEEAIGIKRSWIPYVTFVMATTGCAFGIWMQWWTSGVDWPVNIGGKPYFSLPAFIPVAFECTILLGALSSVAAMFWATGMPGIKRPILDPDLTCSKFAIFVPDDDVGYEKAKVQDLLRQVGAEEVRDVAEF